MSTGLHTSIVFAPGVDSLWMKTASPAWTDLPAYCGLTTRKLCWTTTYLNPSSIPAVSCIFGLDLYNPSP